MTGRLDHNYGGQPTKAYPKNYGQPYAGALQQRNWKGPHSHYETKGLREAFPERGQGRCVIKRSQDEKRCDGSRLTSAFCWKEDFPTQIAQGARAMRL